MHPESSQTVKNVCNLKLFPSKASLESIYIDLCGELVLTAQGFRRSLVITYRFTKSVRTVPLRGVTAAKVARKFVNHWVFPHGLPIYLIADNVPQFTSKFFQDFCKNLNVHDSFTKTYHQQSNAQMETFNQTKLSALRSYVSDSPRDLYLYMSPLTYAYNC